MLAELANTMALHLGKVIASYQQKCKPQELRGQSLNAKFKKAPVISLNLPMVVVPQGIPCRYLVILKDNCPGFCDIVGMQLQPGSKE